MKKDVSYKIKKVINVIAISLFVIAIKVWHLTVVQIEKKKEEAIKPQRKTIVKHSCRGPIYDRYKTPIALNKVKYNAAIYYAHIKQIPAIKWIKDESGKKAKTFPRREHIEKVSKIMGARLKMAPAEIEDLIHSKASLLPHVPYVIKENISEDDYFYLRMLERDYIGIHGEITPERFYPNNKSASTLLGYMGAISQEKYRSFVKDIKYLENLLQEENLGYSDLYFTKDEIKEKLKKLKEKSYSVNDYIGKTGLEYTCEKMLRGCHEKKTFAIDMKGNFLKEISKTTKKKNGKDVYSSISIELQDFAEKLLSRDEKLRDDKNTVFNKKKKIMVPQKQPFIKGGAIVVMNPNNGEVLTLASYPRFDPNDFIFSSNKKVKQKKNKRALRWLETPHHIANIWNGTEDIEREIYDTKKGFFNEKIYLSLPNYLKLIFPKESPLFVSFNKIKNIENAIILQEAAEKLLYFAKTNDLLEALNILFLSEKEAASLKQISPVYINLSDATHKASVFEIKDILRRYLSDTKDIKDKLLLIDLCKLFVHSPSFSNELIEKTGTFSIESYFEFTKHIFALDESLKNALKPIFSSYVFSKWREKNQKAFLKQKREEEKKRKTYARPYVDYLNKMEDFLFNEFYDKNRIAFLTSIIKEEKLSHEKNSFYLQKAIKKITKNNNDKTVSALSFAKTYTQKLSFYEAFDFIKTIRFFKDLDRPLYSRYFLMKSSPTEKDLAMAFYPKNGFKYINSYAYRNSTPLGSIFKVVVAYSALKKHYNYLASKNKNTPHLNPLTIVDVFKWDRTAKRGGSVVVGYSEDSKKPFPRYYKGGRLPKSSHNNIGKIDIIEALAQSSNPYFAILAGDYIHDPEDIIVDAKKLGIGRKTDIDLPGEISGYLPKDLLTNKTGLYSFAIGQHSLVTTPLQTAVMLSTIANGKYVYKPQIIKGKSKILNEVFLPQSVKNTIIEGLRKTVWSNKGSARLEVIKKCRYDEKIKKLFSKYENRLVGKTSTAEIMQKNDITTKKAEKYKDIWFGGIYYPEKNNYKNPELVIVVYLRYGDGGKEATPLVIEMIEKYNELKKKYSKNI